MITNDECMKHIADVLEATDHISEIDLPQALVCAAVVVGKITDECCGNKTCFKRKMEVLIRLQDTFTKMIEMTMEENPEMEDETAH